MRSAPNPSSGRIDRVLPIRDFLFFYIDIGLDPASQVKAIYVLVALISLGHGFGRLIAFYKRCQFFGLDRYFLRRLKKVKKRNAEVLAINQVGYDYPFSFLSSF